MIEVIILGILQGLGEFLPISSSAHLSLVPWIAGWAAHGLNFDIALHLGTLVAVLLYFWRDWLNLIAAWFRTVKKRRIEALDERLSWFIVVGSIPGGIAGALLESQAETVFRWPILTAIALLLVGFVIRWADQKKEKREISQLTWQNTLLIGVAQAFAIIPGVSRSGATISLARYLGFSRYEAARFSFLLSGPIIAGAGLKSISNGFQFGTPEAIGLIVSALVGLISIKFLLSYLAKASLSLFVWYRWVLGLFVIILYLLRLP